MKTHSHTLVFAGLFAMSLNLATSPIATADDRDQVAAANEAFYAAFSEQDLDRLSELWAHGPQARMIGPRAKAIVEGWESVHADWKDVFGAYKQIALTMPTPQVRAGSSVAWVVGTEEVEGTRSSGEEFRASVMATNVFEKVDGRWLMVHHHVSLPSP